MINDDGTMFLCALFCTNGLIYSWKSGKIKNKVGSCWMILTNYQ